MEYRIRVAAIIIEEDRILLIKNTDPENGFEWWAPPGGGLENIDRDIHECAIRETCEETGYKIQTSDILYIREFLTSEFNSHNLEIFLRGEIISGVLHIKNPTCIGHQEFLINEVKWIERKELPNLNVFPEVIKENDFWETVKKKIFTKYLGRKKV